MRVIQSVSINGWIEWVSARDEALKERRSYASWSPYYSKYGVPIYYLVIHCDLSCMDGGV